LKEEDRITEMLFVLELKVVKGRCYK